MSQSLNHWQFVVKWAENTIRRFRHGKSSDSQQRSEVYSRFMNVVMSMLQLGYLDVTVQEKLRSGWPRASWSSRPAPVGGRYGLQYVPREHANCTAGDVRVNRPWASSWPPIFLLISWGEPNIETAPNNPCAITIVGYHGNYVYRVVASIPEWVTCGRFPWKAPTHVYEHISMHFYVHVCCLRLSECYYYYCNCNWVITRWQWYKIGWNTYRVKHL
jgi:hypothetical protein